MSIQQPPPLSNQQRAAGYGSVVGSVQQRSKADSHLHNGQQVVQGVRAPFPSSVGLLIAASACLLHILPNTLLLVSHCANHGCLEPGCHSQGSPQPGHNAGRCFPCYSDTIMDYADDEKVDDPSSQHRSWVAVLAACLRAPIMFLLLSYAHRRLVSNLTGPSGSAIDGDCRLLVFEMVGLMIAILDVMVVFVPNAGSSIIWHVIICSSVIVLWTFVEVPLFASMMNAAISRDRWAILIWILCGISAALAVFLGIGWGPASELSWYLAEWFYIVLQGFLILVIGLVLWQREASLHPKFVR